MDIHQFRRVVRSFLDYPEQLDSDKGDFAIQIGSEVISGYSEMRSGALYIREGESRVLAEEWIVNRLAMLPLLAERLLSSIKAQQVYVVPKAAFLPELGADSQESPIEVFDAVETITEFLDRRPGGTCSVLYLTSDAGEGKTTTIGELARLQAKRFKDRESDWLLVPINLGGKPFLRFDDVVAAALMNQLRFQRLYFDSFIHLVRMGVIVPALDGFEEIFVENVEGDAISSLGALINQLQGEGCLLIAARKAYFEFQSLRDQAKLLDGLRGAEVAFGRIGLSRWGRLEFVEYAVLSGIPCPEAESAYAAIANILTEEHPLLTRPVLVRRLTDVIKTRGLTFIPELRPQASSYFSFLVDNLIEREAKEKWLDKHGDPPRPLLTIKQHHELLAYIAEEMWTSKSAVLSGEMLESLAEIFCESFGLSPIISRQVRERIKQHALIVNTSLGGRDFMFDHENFREFFLGEQLARHMIEEREDDIRRIFRPELLPNLVQEIAVQLVTAGGRDASKVMALVLRVALSEGASSFVRENGGLLIAPLLTCDRANAIRVSSMVFPPDSLLGRSFSDITFARCYFRPTTLEGTSLVNCIFEDCEFEELTFLPAAPMVSGSKFVKPKVHALRIEAADGADEHYNPSQILRILLDHGFVVGEDEDLIPANSVVQIDDDLRITRRAVQAFYRSTTIFENIFRRRLSLDASRFFNFVLPQLIRARIIEEISITAATKYRLMITLSDLSKALAECGGDFARFVELAAGRR